MSINGPSIKNRVDLTNLLAPALSTVPDETALISKTTTWSWRVLEYSSNRLAAHFMAIGLQPGDRIASLMPNRCALIAHYLACLKTGLVATPLNYRYTPPEVDYALNLSGASLLFVHAEREKDVAASTLARNLPFGLISYGGDLDQAVNFETLVEQKELTCELPKPDQNAPAFIFFTSGSTGKPKGVTHSLYSFGAVVSSFSQAMALSRKDIVLPGSSLSHVGSLSTAMAALSATARVVIPHRFDAGEILPLLRETKPSVLVMLPAALIALQQEHDAKPEDFNSLRLCITGGDKFPANLEQKFTDLSGLSISETYGMTEIPDCLFTPPAGEVKVGSVGVVCPGYVASIRDNDGQEVPKGVDGQLWVKGEPLMLGYWNNPEATNGVFRSGWLDTGDVMRVDEKGYFWFRGRKKQIIVHDGSNIAPQEIEEAVMAHPAVASAGVVGVRDEVHGENVWAYVTFKNDTDTPPSGQEIIRCTRELVGYKAPEVIIVLDDMPLNAVGKIDRVTLKQWAAERLNAEISS